MAGQGVILNARVHGSAMNARAHFGRLRCCSRCALLPICFCNRARRTAGVPIAGGQWQVALPIFYSMQLMGLRRDGITYCSTISALAKGNQTARAVEVRPSRNSIITEPAVMPTVTEQVLFSENMRIETMGGSCAEAVCQAPFAVTEPKTLHDT